MRKNTQKTVIKDFGGAFCEMINNFIDEKVREIDEETGKD